VTKKKKKRVDAKSSKGEKSKCAKKACLTRQRKNFYYSRKEKKGKKLFGNSPLRVGRGHVTMGEEYP